MKKRITRKSRNNDGLNVFIGLRYFNQIIENFDISIFKNTVNMETIIAYHASILKVR